MVFPSFFLAASVQHSLQHWWSVGPRRCSAKRRRNDGKDSCSRIKHHLYSYSMFFKMNIKLYLNNFELERNVALICIGLMFNRCSSDVRFVFNQRSLVFLLSIEDQSKINWQISTTCRWTAVRTRQGRGPLRRARTLGRPVAAARSIPSLFLLHQLLFKIKFPKTLPCFNRSRCF